METLDNVVRLHLLVDRSSIEVFGNDGLVVITERIFPGSAGYGIEIFAEGGSVELQSMEVYELSPAVFSHEQGRG
jgi:fructan beta-fructosidase